MSTQKIAAVLVAGGKGTRLGSVEPKGFVPLGEKPLFLHALSVFCTHALVDRVVCVVPADVHRRAVDLVNDPAVVVVSGGAERWQSVRRGVDAAGDAAWVCVHDAARPFVDHAIIDRCCAMRDRYKAIIAAHRMVDTVRHFDGDRATDTVDRSTLVRVGTPQLFHAPTLQKLFTDAAALASPPTDEALLFEQAGIPVGIAWDSSFNFKITTPQDLATAQALKAYRATM